MLTTILVILLIIWLVGGFGGRILPGRIPQTGNWIHVVLVIIVILLVLRLLHLV